MPGHITRIFSDVHYGDRASLVRQLTQLRPLLGEADAVILNGDTLDTRVGGPNPAHTAATRAEVLALGNGASAPVTFLTGNHDPDLSPTHWLELAHGQVFVTHGDVLFDDIVPWGRDARTIRQMLDSALGGMTPVDLANLSFPQRMEVWRSIARAIPQRHQSERHPLKYAAHFIADTVWPPTRFLKIFGAWRQEPIRAAALIARQHPRARFIVLGHTHRPAIRTLPGGPVVINTGSFTAPFGGYTVEVIPGRLRVRRTEKRAGEFRPGTLVAEFPLANP